MNNLNENELSSLIIGAAIKVHTALGPGLFEKAYQECLCYELQKLGLKVEKEKQMPLVYEDVILESGYRMDLLVNERVVIEIKSIEQLHKVHLAQILTYLRLGNYKLGLVINFNVNLLKNGVKRVINGRLDV